MCLQTLLCLTWPRLFPAETSVELIKGGIPIRNLPHPLFIAPFLLDFKGEAGTTQREKSFVWRSWRDAVFQGGWLGKIHQAQGGAKATKTWWRTGSVRPLIFDHAFVGGEAKKLGGTQEGRGEGERCWKNWQFYTKIIYLALFKCSWGVPYHNDTHRITEASGLEETCKIIESSHQPSTTTVTTKPHHPAPDPDSS